MEQSSDYSLLARLDHHALLSYLHICCCMHTIYTATAQSAVSASILHMKDLKPNSLSLSKPKPNSHLYVLCNTKYNTVQADSKKCKICKHLSRPYLVPDPEKGLGFNLEAKPDRACMLFLQPRLMPKLSKPSRDLNSIFFMASAACFLRNSFSL